MNRPVEPGSPSAAKPVKPVMRDEAADWLLSQIADAPHATLRVMVDHGLFKATYATGVTPVESYWYPNLTDALCALIGQLP